MSISLKTVTPLKRKTLQSEVYQQLCDLILQGGLAPGESFTVASIAEALGVSPMPVREAVSRLMSEKALTIVSGRSMGVPKPKAEAFKDLRNVRMEVECMALEWAMARITPQFITDLETKLECMAKAEQSNSVKPFIEANYNFHFTIYNHADSEILRDIISNLWLRISPYFHLLDQYGHFKISNIKHKKLVKFIKNRNVEEAKKALADDISDAYDTLTNALTK